MALAWWFLLFPGAAVLAIWVYLAAQRKRGMWADLLKNGFRAQRDFARTQQLVIGGNADPRGEIALDERRKRLAFFTRGKDRFIFKVLPYSDVIKAEITEDGSSVTETMHGSQIGSAVVGTVLAGGVGAVIGGLSGKQKTTGVVHSIELRVTVKDTRRPHHTFTLFSGESPAGSAAVRNARNCAREWVARIEAVVRVAEDEALTRISSVPSNEAAHLAAGEIAKLQI